MNSIRRFFVRLWTDERGVMVGLVGVVAAAGWGLALASMGGTGDLEDKLLAAEAGLSAKTTELAAVREVQQGLQEASASLADMATQLEIDRGDITRLKLEIGAAEARLGELRAEAKYQRELAADAAATYRTTARARLRAAPTTESDEVALVPAGTPLVVFESVEDGVWYRVGRVGFMHRELLKPVPAAESQ